MWTTVSENEKVPGHSQGAELKLVRKGVRVRVLVRVCICCFFSFITKLTR